MWYKNIASRFFGLVTKHACDSRTGGRTDGQNYDSQDRASIAASRGKNYTKQNIHMQKINANARKLALSKKTIHRPITMHILWYANQQRTVMIISLSSSTVQTVKNSLDAERNRCRNVRGYRVTLVLLPPPRHA